MRTVRASATTGLRAAAFAVACAGCPAIDVVVAEDTPAQPLPPADAGGQTCLQTSDCPRTAYCARTSCDSAQQGECTLRPVSCAEDEQEVCGCDGVIYWNDCLRQRDGIAAAVPGECTTHFTQCGGSQDCRVDDAVCGRLDPGGGDQVCAVPPSGVCWVLPDTCPADPSGARWAPCESSLGNCTDLCDAVRSQQPYGRISPQQCH